VLWEPRALGALPTSHWELADFAWVFSASFSKPSHQGGFITDSSCRGWLARTSLHRLKRYVSTMSGSETSIVQNI
jgi:hypothetical protein